MPTNIELLRALMALNAGDLPPLPRPAPSAPIPLAPVPTLGPLSTDTALAFAAQNPEPVPPRFITPTLPDASLINQEVGAAPTPPAPRSRAERIFNAIAGFGAGVQGQGPQFLAQLQEPQRRYEAQLERYQGRRTEAMERAERRAEREAAQANRANELAYERDYKMWLAKNNDRSDEAKERMRQAFINERDARQARLEADRDQRRELATFKRQIALQIDDRIKAYRDQGASIGKKDYAEELARNDFRMALEQIGEKVPPLSAGAQKANTLVQAKVQRALRLAQGGGGGGAASRRETQDLQRRTAQAAAGIAALEKLKREAIEAPEAERGPILGQMRAMAATLQAQFPDLVETGEQNNWSSARLRQRVAQVSPAAQPQAVEISRADVQEFMQLSGIKSEKEARRQLKAAGGIVK